MNTPNITMPSHCQQIKTEYERLEQITKQVSLARENIGDSGDLTEVKKLQAEWEAAYKELESKLFVSIEQAAEILGKENVFGSKEIQDTFGFSLENIPEIPFTTEDLERAKELGQELILYVDSTENGEPLTAKKMKEITKNKTSTGTTLVASDWFEADSVADKITPRLGWHLSTKETIPKSENKNYLQQTGNLVEYLKNEVFKNQTIPDQYQEAIDEFEKIKKSLEAGTISQDEKLWKPAAEKLSKLKINDFCRENYAEVLYRMAIHEKKTKERLLDSKSRTTYYTWTNSRHSDGKLVNVGSFVSDGADVHGWAPRDSRSSIGVCFSRSE